jgi:hypothetical protein
MFQIQSTYDLPKYLNQISPLFIDTILSHVLLLFTKSSVIFILPRESLIVNSSQKQRESRPKKIKNRELEPHVYDSDANICL